MNAPTSAPAMVLLAIESREWIWIAAGTREQLLEAGLCSPSHFPVGRKRQNRGKDNGRWWRIEYVRGGVWNLIVDKTPEEREAFRTKTKKEIQQSLPSTVEDWRREALRDVDTAARILCMRLYEEGIAPSGFGFSVDGMAAIKRQLARVRMLAANLPIVFNEAVRTQAADAKGNPGEKEMPRLRAPLSLAWCAGAASTGPAVLHA